MARSAPGGRAGGGLPSPRAGTRASVVTSFGLALALVVIGLLAMVVLPGAGLVVGVILIVVAVLLIASAFRRGRSTST